MGDKSRGRAWKSNRRFIKSRRRPKKNCFWVKNIAAASEKLAINSGKVAAGHKMSPSSQEKALNLKKSPMGQKKLYPLIRKSSHCVRKSNRGFRKSHQRAKKFADVPGKVKSRHWAKKIVAASEKFALDPKTVAAQSPPSLENYTLSQKKSPMVQEKSSSAQKKSLSVQKKSPMGQEL